MKTYFFKVTIEFVADFGALIAKVKNGPHSDNLNKIRRYLYLARCPVGNSKESIWNPWHLLTV